MKTLWQPTAQQIKQSQLTEFSQNLAEYSGYDLTNYADLHRWSCDYSAEFWLAIWRYINVLGDCTVPADVPINQLTESQRLAIFQHPDKMPGAIWFAEAKLNFAQNLLQNPRIQSDNIALTSVKENGDSYQISYKTLYLQVAKLADWMRRQGITKGDRVAAVLPNCSQTMVIMLATASLGAIFISCSPDFGAQGLHDRLSQVEPSLLFTVASYDYKGKPRSVKSKIDEVTARLPHCLLVQVPFNQSNEKLNKCEDFSVCLTNQATEIEFVKTEFNHPLYILFSSGTTGLPKCIVHGVGGTLLQHGKELLLHSNVKPKDTLFFYTTCGWMMWNWLASGLLTGANLVLFDGNPLFPDSGKLFELVEHHNINHFGASAKYIQALNQANYQPNQQHELSSLQSILTTGSVLSDESFDYVYQSISSTVRLSSISGGTDIVSCFALGNPNLPVYRGYLQSIGLGLSVEIFDAQGNSLVGETGELVCTKPFPAMPIGFWRDDGSKYLNAYFVQNKACWTHGDFVRVEPNGAVKIFGRSDATLNPGGVRIGSAEIYRQVDKVSEVVDSIAVAQQWQQDVRIVLFVELTQGVNLNDTLANRIRHTILKNTTARHVPAKIIQVADLPRTLNGKLAEIAVREVIHNRDIDNLDALTNPECLAEFKQLDLSN